MSQGALSPVPLSAPAWPTPTRAWATVALLFLAGIISVIDRTVLNIVVDPVRHDLAISEVQIGLVQGLAFGIFYACVGLPMGLLADRVSRSRLIAAGIAVWSAATIASGLAQSFGALFAARLMVGLGEAALGPAAISLIADLFAPTRRGRPLSIFMMGQGLASGIAISLTGLILSAATAGSFVSVLGALAPWRVAFVLFGTLGLGISALLLTLPEPVRRGLPNNSRSAGLPGSAEIRFLWRNRTVLLPLYLAFALCFTAVYGSAAWTPSMLMRGFGMAPGALGKTLGPLTILFAALGPLLAGFLLDRAMRAGRTMARFGLLAAAPLAALPSSLAVLARSSHVAAVLVASSSAAYSVIGIVMFATLQAIVPPRMRGCAIAFTLILNTLIGATCGPLLIAAVTQHVLHNPAKVGWSIALVVIPCLCAGSALYALARSAMKQALIGRSECACLLTEEAGLRVPVMV